LVFPEAGFWVESSSLPTASADVENAMNETITVETDMFEQREVKPHFINPCCFGNAGAAQDHRFSRGSLDLSQDQPVRTIRGHRLLLILILFLWIF
jgi:hypothetical protein